MQSLDCECPAYAAGVPVSLAFPGAVFPPIQYKYWWPDPGIFLNLRYRKVLNLGRSYEVNDIAYFAMREVERMEVPRACIECDASHCGSLKALLQCSACKSVYYCSDQCQKEHAAAHQPHCHAMTRKWKDTFEATIPPEKGRGASLSIASATSNDQTLPDASADLCSICLEYPSEKGAPVATLEACKHVFCLPCLIKWQRHSAVYGDPEREGNDLEDRTSQAGNPPPDRPRLSDFKKKSLYCPCCRTETEDLEECLIQRAKNACSEAKRPGCPVVLKEQLLQEAGKSTSGLLQIQDPDLHAYYVFADVLLARGRPADALSTIQQLMKIDKERHAAIQSHPVLAWIEHARHSYDAADYEQVAFALEAASEMATRIGSPAKPPPVLRGTERTLMYQAAYLLQGEAHRELGQWLDALCVYKKLLLSHQAAKPPENEHDDNSDVAAVQIWKGIAACSYKLVEYAASIDAANRAIEIDRSVPGVHRFKALSLVQLAEQSLDNAKGLMGQAVLTMNQAVLYEVPWDAETRATNLELYQSLCAVSLTAKYT